MDLIIAHNNCPDGWAAAYICKKRYPEAEIILLDHGKNPPYAEVEDKDVIVVDFSWRTREENVRLSKLAKSFRILDHHKTAQAELEGLDFATFDMKRSGAGLAWDYLFGKDASEYAVFGYKLNIGPYEGPENPYVATKAKADYEKQEAERTEPRGIRSEGVLRIQNRPWWVNYVEDQDLWRWALPNSKAVGQYLKCQPRTIEAWDGLEHADVGDAAYMGRAINIGTDYYIREIVAQRQLGTINGLTVGVVNAPYVNCSEVGHELAKESQVGMSYFERGDGIIQFSLRSIGDIDVSAIAKENGGGGHKNAAGFQLPLKKGRDFVDVVLARYWANNWIEDPKCAF